jgi:type II secretory pathway pseudopilin PulG
MIARLSRRLSEDGGLGLPEVLVSMAMFGIVMAALGAVFTGTIDVVRFAQTKNSTTADVRIAMEAMTRTVRVAIRPEGEATALLDARANRIQFYTSLVRGAGQTQSRPTLVTYEVDPATNCLNETQVPATTNPGADIATRPFVWTALGTTKCLIRTYAPPTFEYYDSGSLFQDDQVTVIAPVPLPPAGASLALGQRKTVVSVQVSLNVQDPKNTDINGVLARDRVTLSNVLTALKAGNV